MIQLIKQTIKGRAGKSNYYAISNIRLESEILKWDEFTFYSPSGNFTVPADEILISRDSDLDTTLMVEVTRNEGLNAMGILEGADWPKSNINEGGDGDLIIFGNIPSDPANDIIINYKEITNDSVI